MSDLTIADVIATYDSAHSHARSDPSEANLLLLYALDALRTDLLAALSAQRSPEPVNGIDLSELTAAVKGLAVPEATPAPGAVDLTPMLAGLSDTALAQLDALKNLTTRIGAIGRGGGGGPSVVAINDASNNRLVINEDGSINTQPATPAPTPISTVKATYTTSGDHTLLAAPASPLALQPTWFYAQAKGALDTGVVIVAFTMGGRSYEFELTGSQPFSHSATWNGAVGEALVVNTSSTAAVMCNADYRTYTP